MAGIADAAVRGGGKPDSVFYQDGPYFPEAGSASPYTTIATDRNGDVVAQGWFENAGIALHKMPQGELFVSLIRSAER